MPYNESLAERIRQKVEVFGNEITEKRMFGGLTFLYHGKMTIGIIKDDLAGRVVGEKMDKVMKRKHVRPMDFTKKPMKEFIYVAPEGYEKDKDLEYYLDLGIEHARRKLGMD